MAPTIPPIGAGGYQGHKPTLPGASLTTPKGGIEQATRTNVVARPRQRVAVPTRSRPRPFRRVAHS
eukprot:5686976-Lingulodinium_polyedra.AAC.1